MKRNDKKRGFTIVELVIVIAIIGVLASVTIVGFTGALKDAKEKAALLEARNIYAEYQVETATDGYITDCIISVEGTDFYFKVTDGKLGEAPVSLDSAYSESKTVGNGTVYTKP